MRVDMSNPMNPGIVVHLDGEFVPGCIEADDVEGWVKRMKVVQGSEGEAVPRYMRGQDGPLTEIVDGEVELKMLLYNCDENGKVIDHDVVPMEWDTYLKQRRDTFAHIHRNDQMKRRNVLALLDEWYGKARTQDAQARQRKASAEESGEVQGEGQGKEDGSSSPNSRAGTGPSKAVGSSSRKDKIIGKSR